MQIVTFFSPCRAVGKTTAVAAVAAAFVENGERIGVIEFGEPSEKGFAFNQTQLSDWETAMHRVVGECHVRVDYVTDFETLIRALCFCEFSDVDFILIDAPQEYGLLTREVLDRADLVIMPFCNPRAATRNSQWIEQNASIAAKTVGLITCTTRNEAVAISAHTQFEGAPILSNELPFSSVLERQFKEGSLFYLDLHGSRHDKEIVQSAFVAVEAADACLAATAIADEIRTFIRTFKFDPAGTRQGSPSRSDAIFGPWVVESVPET
ncbi:MAG: hypothetical protein AAFQ58_10035 [Pseudomonadota bacterium]